LSLYANQLAWLNSRQDRKGKARRELLEYDMPDISYCRYIYEMAVEFGLKPEWSELNAWSELTQANLNKFEAKAIHLMGLTYNNKYSEYDGNDAPRPFIGNTKQDSNSIRDILRNH